MRLIILITFTMMAFAMNSVLNRAAVHGGYADASSFALIRVLSGACVLTTLVLIRGSGGLEFFQPRRWAGAFALAVYMIGFSLAYVSINAGLGALILFGTVQIAMFAHAAVTGATPTKQQILGAGAAFLGLLIALIPSSGVEANIWGSALMLVAGLGWAAYTISGRGAENPIGVTATHFVLCLPFMAILLMQSGLMTTPTGWVLAILAGGVTSGLGYSLWYYVLPRLPGASAAIVQLTVPILAIALGALLLGEAIETKVIVAAILVIGGVGYALVTNER